jgi:hypothetical protein
MAPNRRFQSAWMRSGLVALAASVLFGCSSGVASSPPTAQGELPPASTPTLLPEIAPTDVAPRASPSSAVATSPSAEPTPTVRHGLHATDPGSVELASGRPQLVEFFAFW